jgi:hypothetical protein
VYSFACPDFANAYKTTANGCLLGLAAGAPFLLFPIGFAEQFHHSGLVADAPFLIS